MIRRATETDIPIVEGILLDAVRWMDGTGRHQWPEESVRWAVLSEAFAIEDFYIDFQGGVPAACVGEATLFGHYHTALYVCPV